MDRIQWVSILGSALLLVAVLEMVRSRRLQEEYSILWIFTGGVLLLLSLVMMSTQSFNPFIYFVF